MPWIKQATVLLAAPAAPVGGAVTDFGEVGSEPVRYEGVHRGLPGEPTVVVVFVNGPPVVTRPRLDVQDLTAGDGAKIHIRELTFHQPAPRAWLTLCSRGLSSLLA